MISTSTLLHTRFPFSLFLLPVYLLALTTIPDLDVFRAAIVFMVWHLFLYPASNGYNSYYDRDTGSIGTLEKPPLVTKDLLYFSLALDALGTLLAFAVSWQFALLTFVYGIASKLYSNPLVRIKRRPLVSWLYVGVGQGAFVFWLTAASVGRNTSFNPSAAGVLPIAAAFFFLLGIYPLTQVYQHSEDAKRGDKTLSLLLGVRGTFACAVVCLVTAIALFVYYFNVSLGAGMAMLFCFLLLPAVACFIIWFLRCLAKPSEASYRNAMLMNTLSSAGCIVYSIITLFQR